jgi:hypothetical protein
VIINALLTPAPPPILITAFQGNAPQLAWINLHMGWGCDGGLCYIWEALKQMHTSTPASGTVGIALIGLAPRTFITGFGDLSLY